MGLFSSGGSKLPKWAKPYAQQGLATAQSVFADNQDNLNSLTSIAADAATGAAGKAFGENPFLDNAKGAARTISNGFFLGQNPGQSTYDRLQGGGGSPSFSGGGIFGKNKVMDGGFQSPAAGYTAPTAPTPGNDPSMGLLGAMATDRTPQAGAGTLNRLAAGSGNPGDAFASAVAGGQYLNNQPSAGLYGEMMDRSYSTSNPYLDDIIRQNDENVSTQAGRMFGARGMGAGIGSAYADVLSKNLADTGGQIRFQDYTNAENRRLQAGGQSDAAFASERGRMGEANSLLSSNFNAGQDRSLAAGQALNQFDQANRGQMLSAAQSLGGQFTDGADRNADLYRTDADRSAGMYTSNADRSAGLYTSDANRNFDRYRTDADRGLLALNTREDRALDAAKAGDAVQQSQIAQMLQSLGLTGQLENAGYAGYAPTNDLLKTAGTLPYAGLDAYQTALSNLLGTSKVTKGPGIGSQLAGAGAQLGSAAIMASDRRLKRDIDYLGQFDDGLGIYQWDYIDSDRFGEGRFTGVMADEVEQLRPWALGPLIDGEFASVNYGAL